MDVFISMSKPFDKIDCLNQTRLLKWSIPDLMIAGAVVISGPSGPLQVRIEDPQMVRAVGVVVAELRALLRDGVPALRVVCDSEGAMSEDVADLVSGALVLACEVA